MRALAGELRIETMSPYNHMCNKGVLLLTALEANRGGS
jgi:hypothetical protein